MADKNDSQDYSQKIYGAFALLMTGDKAQALEMVEGLLESHPHEPAGYYLLGILAYQTGDFGRAIELINTAHTIDSECREYVDVLAILNTLIGKLADGLYFAKLATALESNPKIASIVPANLSNYFKALGRVKLSNQYVNAMIAFNQRDFDRSISLCEMELRLNEDHDPCMALIGKCNFELGRYDRAVGAYQSAIRYAPDIPNYYMDLGDALYHLGRFDEALACHREALRRDRESVELATRALAGAEYLEDSEAQRGTFQNELDRRLSAQPTSERVKNKAQPSSGKVRIGYISNSFYSSEAGTFILGALDNQDYERFDVSCYSQSIRRDAINTRLRTGGDWRDVFDITDDVMEMIISGDEVDVLVDLCGHTENNRAGLIAAHPAPVQVGWLEHPQGLGMEGIDIVLGDGVTAETDRKALGKNQQLIILKHGLMALEPLEFLPDVMGLPAKANEYVTFGGQCDLATLGPGVAALWSEILHQIPRSRLLLGNVQTLSESSHAQAIELFAHYGVAEQLHFWDTEGDERPNPEFFNHVDVFLDTFPVSGRLNLSEALWMGVPVLSLKGSRRSGQIGASLLASAAQPQWICQTPEEFVEKAVSLAGDPAALADIRSSLRQNVRDSMLFRPEVFARSLEEALLKAVKLKGPKKAKAKSAKGVKKAKPAAKKAPAKKAPSKKKAAQKKAPVKKAKGAK